MKKKVIKKKVSAPSDDLELPMARMDDDVAEDYKVIDMSDIAAPVIEFELPNLQEKVIEVKEEKKKKTSSKTKKKKGEVKGKQETLTAEKLNNELVGLRSIIVTGKNQLMSKLVRQKKKLEAKKGGKSEEAKRKVSRLAEEIVGLKTIDKDTISKFAALNTKSIAELKIDGKTPVSERLMYKLATQESVVKEVESIREKYTEWNKTAAFFMQRLGLQYSNKPKKEKKQKEGQEKEDSEASDEEKSQESENAESDQEDEEEGAEEDEETNERGEEYNESDIEMVDSDEEAGDEAAEKRRHLLLGLIGVKEDKSRPALKPKKRKIDTDEDEVGVVQKKSKAKETVKQEMKQILEKELKSKEVQNPKKNGRTTKTPKIKKPVESKKEEKEVEEEKVPMEDDSDQKTLVMKVDLSKGGKIAVSKGKPAAATKPEARKGKEEDDNDDDDESNAFFLPKNGSAPKKTPARETKKTVKLEKNRAPVVQKMEEETAPAPEKAAKKKGLSKKNTTTGEMHPSWAASQLKKKEMQSAKPCGKKITFGDDED